MGGKILTNSPFRKGDLLSIELNNKYGACIVLQHEQNSPQGLTLLLILDYNENKKIKTSNVKTLYCLMKENYYMGLSPYIVYCNAIEFRRKQHEYIKSGEIKIKKIYEIDEDLYPHMHWDSIVQKIESYDRDIEEKVRVSEML